MSRLDRVTAAAIAWRIRARLSSSADTGTGVAAGAGGGATAGASAASRMIASGVPTGTFSPGRTRIRSTTPGTKTSTSIAPLSVSTSAIMSPRRTASPGCLYHVTRRPAVMSAPSTGMRNSATAVSQDLPHLCDDAGSLGQRRVLEMFWVGYGHFGRTYARDRSGELGERSFHDSGAHFGCETSGAPRLIHHDCASRLPHRCEDRRIVEGPQRAQVHDLSLDSLRRELCGGIERLADGPPVSDNRDVRPRPSNRRVPDVRVPSGGLTLAFQGIQRRMLEDKDG